MRIPPEVKKKVLEEIARTNAALAAKYAEATKALLERVNTTAAAKYAKLDKEWQAEFGEEYPQTIDELSRWAARVGFSPHEFDKLAGAELFSWIEGYCLRLKDKQPADSADSKADSSKKIPASNRVLKAINFVNQHYRKVEKGKATSATIKAILSEFLDKPIEAKEVKNLARQLREYKHLIHSPADS